MQFTPSRKAPDGVNPCGIQKTNRGFDRSKKKYSEEKRIVRGFGICFAAFLRGVGRNHPKPPPHKLAVANLCI